MKETDSVKKIDKIKRKYKNYKNEYNKETDELMKAYYEQVCDKLRHNISNVIPRITRKELKELIEEMKQEPEYKDSVGNGLVKKTYKKGSERKPHKQQERTIWKSLVDLNISSNDNYEEIIKLYPNVTKNAYNICRSRLKKELNN